MDYVIKSGELTVGVTTKGGQFTSMKDQNGVEYVWQADPAYWANQTPLCFPIVGSLRNKTATIGNGKTATMERHGVVRNMEFSPVEVSDTSVTLSVKADDETLARYPYQFEYRVTYSVSGKTLKVTFTAINHDSEPMPYTLGGHPAFNCPMGKDGAFEDYVVEFEKPETADCPTPIKETGLMDYNLRTRMLTNETTLPMRHELFKVDAVVFDRLVSRKAKLYNPKTGMGVEMDFHDFKYLLVWSAANNAPFVALEPWNGLTTCNDEDDVFEHKHDIVTLQPGESHSYSFTVTIL